MTTEKDGCITLQHWQRLGLKKKKLKLSVELYFCSFFSAVQFDSRLDSNTSAKIRSLILKLHLVCFHFYLLLKELVWLFVLELGCISARTNVVIRLK